MDHAIRADLLHRLGRSDEAGDACSRAMEITENDVEGAYLAAHRASLAD